VMDVAFADESTSGVVRGATHLVSVHISLMRLRIWGLDHCAFVASFYWMQFPALGRASSCGASQIVPKSRVSQAFQPPPRCLNTEYLYDFEKLSGRNDAGFFSNQLRFLDQCLMSHSLYGVAKAGNGKQSSGRVQTCTFSTSRKRGCNVC